MSLFQGLFPAHPEAGAEILSSEGRLPPFEGATGWLGSEPPTPDHPLLKLPNVVCTPHVGSRTYESVVRQATTAVKNLILAMNGEKPLAQINPEVPVRKVV